MAITYVNLVNATGDGSSATVTLGSIPQTYTDLLLTVSGRTLSTQGTSYGEFFVRPNNDTGNATYRTLEYQGGTSVISRADSPVVGGRIATTTASADMYSSLELYIPSYTASYNKQMRIMSAVENGASSASLFICAGLWRSTAAITSLVCVSNAGAFSTLTTFRLYGIKNS